MPFLLVVFDFSILQLHSQIFLHHISFSLHPPCQLSQPRTRAAVCQVWIDAMLAELSSWPVLDVMQIFSLGWGSRDQSECELCNNSDGRHWQVFGLGGIWPTPPTQGRFLLRNHSVLVQVRYFVHNSAEIKKMGMEWVGIRFEVNTASELI